MKIYWNEFYQKIINFLKQLENPSYRIKVFFVMVFLFLSSFMFLTNSNPFYFFLPYKIYPIKLFSFKTKRFYYYSYDRDTKELKELQAELMDHEEIDKNIYQLAKMIQEPPIFLGSAKNRTETVYFPAYSLGITLIHKDNHILYIFFNSKVIENYPYQRRIHHQNDFDFLANYKNALVKTIFKNYADINEIQWIENQRIDIYKK